MHTNMHKRIIDEKFTPSPSSSRNQLATMHWLLHAVPSTLTHSFFLPFLHANRTKHIKHAFARVALTSLTRREVQFLRIISQMHAQGLRMYLLKAFIALQQQQPNMHVARETCPYIFKKLFTKQFFTLGQIDKDFDCTATIIEAVQMIS